MKQFTLSLTLPAILFVQFALKSISQSSFVCTFHKDLSQRLVRFKVLHRHNKKKKEKSYATTKKPLNDQKKTSQNIKIK